MIGQFKIVGHDGNNISVEVVRSEGSPGANDEDTWLACAITAQVSGFRGAISTSLTAEELQRLLKDLQRLTSELEGQAQFYNLEGDLELLLDMGSRGDARVEGHLTQRSGAEVTLSFRFETDQTFLSETVRGLQQITQELATTVEKPFS